MQNCGLNRHDWLRGLFAACLALVGTAELLAADAAAIVLDRVANDVEYLASDELEGRGVGTEGLDKAAEYIADEFKHLGLKSPTGDGKYAQEFPILIKAELVPEKTSCVLRDQAGQRTELKLGQDYQPLIVGGEGKADAPIIFAGYGISAPKLGYDDYESLDVAGKVVLILRREPQQDDPHSKFDGDRTSTHSYIRTKLKQAQEHKAAAVLFVNDPFTVGKEGKDRIELADGFGTNTMGIPFAQVSQELANRLLADAGLTDKQGQPLTNLKEIEASINKTFQPVTGPLTNWSAELDVAVEKVYSKVKNIIGVIDGAGSLADETVIVGAHYDHLGMGGAGSRRPQEKAVHNGADDNASGTAALLELAREYTSRKVAPPRRLVFMAFSAEERGLIGSRHYVNNPLFPLEQTVAMFNFDMVGRMRDGKLTVYGLGTAKEFADLVEKANDGEKLQLNTVEGVMAASDHFVFFQKEIPVFHFFSGMTKEYHTPDDDFATINVNGIARVVRFASGLLDLVLNLPERPKFVEVKTAMQTRGGMAYLGVIPDYGAEVNGLLITGTNQGSPAEKAGLKADDIITRFGEILVTDIQGLADALRTYKPGETIQVIVLREGKEITLTVTLGDPAKR